MKLFFFVFCCLLLETAFSAEIRFPEEELESESVLPVFKNNKNVIMNQRVRLKHKLNFMGSIVHRSDEPFFAQLAFDGGVGFFFNEAHGIGLSAIYFQSGLSFIGKQLSTDGVLNKDTKQPVKFDAGLAPHPQYAIFFYYATVPFYGKLSFSKNIAVNFNISILGGGGGLLLAKRQRSGLMTLEQEKWVPAAYLALNQKIFIGKQFYIHWGLNLVGYYGPNPIDKKLRNTPISIDFEHFSNTVIIRLLAKCGIGILVF